MSRLGFCYCFHAVGQGLFASGRLEDGEKRRRFDWVFDCGTSSSQAYIAREIIHYQSQFRPSQIDLFCISHFDQDHINGAFDLLRIQPIRTLILPYFSIVNRMQIALSTRNISGAFLNFLIDPAGYLSTLADANIGEIIYIVGGGEPPPEAGVPSPDDDRPQGDGPRDYNFEGDFKLHDLNIPPPIPPVEPPVTLAGKGAAGRVRMLSHLQAFSVSRVWEFVFYNINKPNSILAPLQGKVTQIVNANRYSDGSYDGKKMVEELRKEYDNVFGKSGAKRNAISLVAYGGPQRASRVRNGVLLGSDVPLMSPAPRSLYPANQQYTQMRAMSCIGIRYFGDFPLDSPPMLLPIRQHFGIPRWNNQNVLQVPHHGSRHSWYCGAVREFPSGASVFSSRITSIKHPSPIVWIDLAGRGIMAVNEYHRAFFRGYLDF